MKPRFILGIGAIVVTAAAATGFVIAPHDRSVTISESACAADWSGPTSGRQTIALHDTSPDTVQVYLIDAHNLVYGETRDLNAGSTRDLATTLGAGRYALRCVFSNGTVLTSMAYAVKGSVAGAVVGVPPMPDLDLEAAVGAYRDYVARSLPTLSLTVAALVHDIDRGNLRRARADWLPAHLAYERLGAAYTSFGDFDGAINGDTEGLADGVHDASWTGFFRIEYGLWHGEPVTTLKPVADRLRTDVQGLADDFPSQDIDPFDLPLRTHEILENALQFQVSGADDYGSGTSLATAYANAEGTRAVLGTIASLIKARQPALFTALDQGISTVETDLMACRTRGTWISADGVGRPLHQKIDADLGALLEQLATVPNLLAERTSA